MKQYLEDEKILIFRFLFLHVQMQNLTYFIVNLEKVG